MLSVYQVVVCVCFNVQQTVVFNLNISCLPLRPANGGRPCIGATYQFQICNSNECEDIYSDPREEQCHAWDPRFEHSNKHHWLPYEHPDREYASTYTRNRKWFSKEGPNLRRADRSEQYGGVEPCG